MNFPGGFLNLDLRFLTQSWKNHHEISDCLAIPIDCWCTLAKRLRCIENRQGYTWRFHDTEYSLPDKWRTIDPVTTVVGSLSC